MTALSLFGIFAAAAMAAANPVVARVPFDFTAAGIQLTAGVYTIEPQGMPGVLLIRDADGHTKGMFVTNKSYRGRNETQPLLVFNRYGDRYFLSRVWGQGETGATVPMSKIERELTASSAVPAAEPVVVVATVRR
jgi:hypothetical protein